MDRTSEAEGPGGVGHGAVLRARAGRGGRPGAVVADRLAAAGRAGVVVSGAGGRRGADTGGAGGTGGRVRAVRGRGTRYAGPGGPDRAARRRRALPVCAQPDVRRGDRGDFRAGGGTGAARVGRLRPGGDGGDGSVRPLVRGADAGPPVLGLLRGLPPGWARS